MKVSDKTAIICLVIVGILFLYMFRVVGRNIVNTKNIVIVTEQQAIDQATDWWKSKLLQEGTKSRGLSRSSLLNGKMYYEVGFLDNRQGGFMQTWLGAGYSWDEAFLTAIDVGYPAFCCDGAVDWDTTNKYLKALGKPEYKKVSR